MKTRVPQRPALALAGLCIAVGLVLLVAVTSSAASQSLSVTATDAVIGQTVQATAQLSETEGSSVSGEISFEVFGPDDPDCSGTALSPAPDLASVDGEGEYPSGEFTPPAVGAYRWSAHYSGDSENPAADSVCAATSIVSKASLGLEGAASAATVGAAIHDEATVVGGLSPTGEVTFRVYGPGDTACQTPLSTDSVALQGGHAVSPDFLTQQAGEFRWTIEYPGDASNEASDLPCGSADQGSAVAKASPTLVGTATPAVAAGTPITDEVTVGSGFTPGGQLLFRAYGPGDETCGEDPAYEATVAVAGNGSYSPAGFSPAVGAYRWTVEYSGDGNDEAFDLPCGSANQESTVSKASPTLTGTATSGVVVGSPITDGVTLANGVGASGQLLFRAYGPADPTCAGAAQYEATVGVAGNGSYAPPGFSPNAGLYLWTVAYSGDGSNEAFTLPCGSPNQASAVGKASPSLSGAATSAVVVGSPITDGVSLAAGFNPGGQLLFRAYGPGNQTCAGAPAYEATVAVAGNGSYSPAGFSPGAGLYRWTVDYAGDLNNQSFSLPCGSPNQASAVGVITPTIAVGATGATVGNPVIATATLQEGAIPTGQITFTAFPPGDANCSGAAAFSSTVAVAGNGSYRSAAFAPSRVGTFRWTVSYSGDPNHAAIGAGCGGATSNISSARPSIVANPIQRLAVGASFKVTATLQGGYSPGGTVSFEIYRRTATGCDNPVTVGAATVAGNGTVSSDPLVARQPGAYSFGATYSGDAANQGAADSCAPSDPAVRVSRRTPRVKPRAHLSEGSQISIRAHLSGALSPSGTINFRLYRPGDKQCKRKPAFSGSLSVKSNGSYLLGQYFATKHGVYRLSAGYSGDQRNRQYKPTCRGAQQIRIG